MTGTDFNLATSILFVGYLLMQLPSNLLLTRVKPSWLLGGAMAIWYVPSWFCRIGLTSQGHNIRSSGGNDLVHRLGSGEILPGVCGGAFLPGGDHVDVRIHLKPRKRRLHVLML